MANIKTKQVVKQKECTKCGEQNTMSHFVKVPCAFFPDGYFPYCDICIGQILEENDYSLEIANKLCQFADLPFIPNDWLNISKNHKERSFIVYASIFGAANYEGPDWVALNEEYLKFEEERQLNLIIPQIKEYEDNKIKEKWGENYSAEELSYLERLYQGIMDTQNVNGSLQLDQALKLCKISLIIDKRIRAEEDFDKILKSYDSLAKIADFTPKNLKNTNEFESCGELWGYIEKTGWQNPFYKNESNDIVDLTMKEIQIHNRNLYINETGIDEEIKDRISALKIADDLDKETGFFDIKEDELDQLEAAAYDLEEFEEDAGL